MDFGLMVISTVLGWNSLSHQLQKYVFRNCNDLIRGFKCVRGQENVEGVQQSKFQGCTPLTFRLTRRYCTNFLAFLTLKLPGRAKCPYLQKYWRMVHMREKNVFLNMNVNVAYKKWMHSGKKTQKFKNDYTILSLFQKM